MAKWIVQTTNDDAWYCNEEPFFQHLKFEGRGVQIAQHPLVLSFVPTNGSHRDERHYVPFQAVVAIVEKA